MPSGLQPGPHDGPNNVPPVEPHILAEAECRPTGLLAASRHARIYAAQADEGPVVLKVIADDPDPVCQSRFAREGRCGLKLHHPHLVRTMRCGDGWIVLGDLRDQAGSGEDLSSRLARGAPGISCAAGLGGIAAALSHLHARGFVHRDVKPGNIVVAPDGRLVLIDLGALGHLAGDRLGAGELIGSPAWMAPEQIRGELPHPGADIWSLSLVLAQTLCGIPPFTGSAEAVLRRRGAGGGPDPAFVKAVAGIPNPAAVRLIQSGLAERSEDRPPAAAFMRLSGIADPS